MYENIFLIYILRYGDVFWTMMDPIPIDPDIVARYANKTMAVVGYETNQVRKGLVINFVASYKTWSFLINDIHVSCYLICFISSKQIGYENTRR